MTALGCDDYHNGKIWPWFSNLFVKACEARGLRARDRAPIEQLMLRDGAVYELYEAEGTFAGLPYRTLFFASGTNL